MTLVGADPQVRPGFRHPLRQCRRWRPVQTFCDFSQECTTTRDCAAECLRDHRRWRCARRPSSTHHKAASFRWWDGPGELSTSSTRRPSANTSRSAAYSSRAPDGMRRPAGARLRSPMVTGRGRGRLLDAPEPPMGGREMGGAAWYEQPDYWVIDLAARSRAPFGASPGSVYRDSRCCRRAAARQAVTSFGGGEDQMKHEPSTGRAGDDVRKLVNGNRWMATFTFLDVSGAVGSSPVRRLGTVFMNMWKLMVHGISDRSKSRVVGV